MTDRLRWWVIPGALVILARMVTLEPYTAPVTPPPAALGGETAAALVHVRDASGSRHEVVLPFASENALVVRFPPELVGLRVQMVLWQRLSGVRQAEPWLQLHPRVRADATVPIAGLAPGHYDVEIEQAGVHFAADDVTMPGEALLAPRQ